MHAIIENQLAVMALAIGIEEAVITDRTAIFHVDDKIVPDALVAYDRVTRRMHAYYADLIEGYVLAGV